MEHPGIERLAAIEAELAQVERAIARIDEGTYGRCEVCGGALDDGVLAAEPLTSVCGGHLGVVPEA